MNTEKQLLNWCGHYDEWVDMFITTFIVTNSVYGIASNMPATTDLADIVIKRGMARESIAIFNKAISELNPKYQELVREYAVKHTSKSDILKTHKQTWPVNISTFDAQLGIFLKTLKCLINESEILEDLHII